MRPVPPAPTVAPRRRIPVGGVRAGALRPRVPVRLPVRPGRIAALLLGLGALLPLLGMALRGMIWGLLPELQSLGLPGPLAVPATVAPVWVAVLALVQGAERRAGGTEPAEAPAPAGHGPRRRWTMRPAALALRRAHPGPPLLRAWRAIAAWRPAAGERRAPTRRARAFSSR